MSYLLDTNVISAHMKRAGGLAHRFFQHAGRLTVPSIVAAELYAGAYLRADPTPLVVEIDRILADLTVIDFDLACAGTFGRIRG